MEEEEYVRPLSPGGVSKALLVGIGAGVLAALLSITITLLNSPLYHQAANEGKTVVSSADFTLTGLACLSIVLNLAVCFLAGMLVGKIAVRRQLGFFAGALAGIVIFLGGFVTNFIPNYPGTLNHSSTTVATAAGGLITSLVFLLVWLFIGGLIGLAGAWTATRKHPHYLYTKGE